MSRPRRRQVRIGPRTHIRREPEGWSVSVTRRDETYRDYFGDAVWGSRATSLLAAQHFRDRLLLRIDPDVRVRRRTPRGRSSRTGLVGVSLEWHVVEGRAYERYVACWPDLERGAQRRRFLVERYGRERARQLAIEARESGVRRFHAQQLARQREDARGRLQEAPPRPRPVKDPRSRKGISMARRGRPRE